MPAYEYNELSKINVLSGTLIQKRVQVASLQPRHAASSHHDVHSNIARRRLHWPRLLRAPGYGKPVSVSLSGRCGAVGLRRVKELCFVRFESS